MSVPYDYDLSNVEHLRAVVSEQEATIEYLRECCKAEEVENARLRDIMYDRVHDHGIQHMTDDELRVTAANVMEENQKLRELLRFAMLRCNADNPRCDACIDGYDGVCELEQRMFELGVIE